MGGNNAAGVEIDEYVLLVKLVVKADDSKEVVEATGGEAAEETAAEEGVMYTTEVSVLVWGGGVLSTVAVVVVVDTMLMGEAVRTTVLVTRCVRGDEDAETVWTVVFGGNVEVAITVSTTVIGDTPEPPPTPDPDPDPPSIGTTEYLGIRGLALAGSIIGNDKHP
jgi:hypothetical protein